MKKLLIAGAIAAIAVPVTAAGAANILSGKKPAGKQLVNPVTTNAEIAATKKRGNRNEGASGFPRLTDSSLSAQPCKLVTASQAGAIFGAKVRKPREAPLGPTCIYRTSSKRQFVTVGVQQMHSKQLKPLTSGMNTLRIARRTAYCGASANPMLYVRLSATSVLSISGGCDVARKFAAKAVPKLVR